MLHQQKGREDVESLGSSFRLQLMKDGGRVEGGRGGHEGVKKAADASCYIHNTFCLVAYRAFKSFEPIWTPRRILMFLLFSVICSQTDEDEVP